MLHESLASNDRIKRINKLLVGLGKLYEVQHHIVSRIRDELTMVGAENSVDIEDIRNTAIEMESKYTEIFNKLYPGLDPKTAEKFQELSDQTASKIMYHLKIN